MEINLVRLVSRIHPEQIQENNNGYIDDINNILFDDDIVLKEKIKNPLLTVFFIESGGVEGEFVKIYKKYLNGPILLLCNNLNNSLPASIEIQSFCISHEITSFVMSQGLEEAAYIIKEMGLACLAKSKIVGSCLGVIGEPSDWLIASKVDFPSVNKKYGISLIKIGIDELICEYNKKKIGNVPHLRTIQKKYNNKTDLNKALYLYSAIKRLVIKYNLKGLTIRCFDLLKELKTTACLALALLNEEGIVSACEGDVPALLTMYFLSVYTDRPTFMANPSKIDLKEHTILLAHCTVSLNMLSKYEFDTHFESNIGVAVKGEFSSGDVSICKLSSDLNHYTIMSGKIKSSPHFPGYCRTQVEIEVEPADLYEYFNEPYGNHLIMAYGDYKGYFLTLMNLFLKNPQ